MILNLRHQKYLILTFLFFLNTTLGTTFIHFNNYWYVFVIFLALQSIINSFNILCILWNQFKTKGTTYRFIKKNYLYVIPCYNESEEELTASLNSLTNQYSSSDDNRALFIICDGKVIGQGNEISTDNILKKILNVADVAEYYEYDTWDKTKNIVKIYKGMYLDKINFILCIKERNYGKRDSLVLVRSLCYQYNKNLTLNKNDKEYTNQNKNELYVSISNTFKNIFKTELDYIIGIDADTVFDYYCSNELIKTMLTNPNIYGCVGYVDISPNMNKLSPFVLYQYAEYMYAQCLKRYAQSVITGKVNCLSGCNQILKVSRETCGPEILARFNYLPKENENIFNHIRSYASEDRNHVCLMLSMYPYVKTVQNINAVAYTSVPNKITIFASQRRRWNLGANSNDMMLIYLPGIHILERISAFVNVLTFGISPFIFISTIYFFKAIFTHPTILMFYLSIIILIPILHSFLIPLIIRPLTFRQTIYYYTAFLFYLLFGSIINLGTYFYALLNMDTIKWGKTRTIVKNLSTTTTITRPSITSYSESLPPPPSPSISSSSDTKYGFDIESENESDNKSDNKSDITISTTESELVKNFNPRFSETQLNEFIKSNRETFV
jgi:chitin synthase